MGMWRLWTFQLGSLLRVRHSEGREIEVKTKAQGDNRKPTDITNTSGTHITNVIRLYGYVWWLT